MATICAICVDSSISNILSTRCGHVYHSDCLQQWLESSKTCPECRQSVKNNQLRKIYFNFANSEDSSSLEKKVDNIDRLLKSKENVIRTYETINKILQKDKQKQETNIRKLEEQLTVQHWIEFKQNQRLRYLEERLKDCGVKLTKLRKDMYFIQDLAVRAVLYVICNCSTDFTILMSTL
ncbi:uncharacterized protein LOC143430138 [Xylocopa sonorina]|uniref:uncharacterized protein LOC143430138 n=1 Tax=Xylocopa sonorina TaxID=1818115 RepID=UPI00403ABF0D